MGLLQTACSYVLLFIQYGNLRSFIWSVDTKRILTFSIIIDIVMFKSTTLSLYVMSHQFFIFSSFPAFFLMNKVFFIIPLYLYYCIIRYTFLFYFLRRCSRLTVYVFNLCALPLNNTVFHSVRILHLVFRFPLPRSALLSHPVNSLILCCLCFKQLKRIA